MADVNWHSLTKCEYCGRGAYLSRDNLNCGGCGAPLPISSGDAMATRVDCYGYLTPDIEIHSNIFYGRSDNAIALQQDFNRQDADWWRSIAEGGAALPQSLIRDRLIRRG